MWSLLLVAHAAECRRLVPPGRIAQNRAVCQAEERWAANPLQVSLQHPPEHAESLVWPARPLTPEEERSLEPVLLDQPGPRSAMAVTVWMAGDVERACAWAEGLQDPDGLTLRGLCGDEAALLEAGDHPAALHVLAHRDAALPGRAFRREQVRVHLERDELEEAARLARALLVEDDEGPDAPGLTLDLLRADPGSFEPQAILDTFDAEWRARNAQHPDALDQADTLVRGALDALARQAHIQAQATGSSDDYAVAAALYERIDDPTDELRWFHADARFRSSDHRGALELYDGLEASEYRDGVVFYRTLAWHRLVLESEHPADVGPLCPEHQALVAAIEVALDHAPEQPPWIEAYADARMAWQLQQADAYLAHGDDPSARRVLESMERSAEVDLRLAPVLMRQQDWEALEAIAPDMAWMHRFKHAFELAEQGEVLAAAQAYEALLEDRTAENYDIALYNAANNYDRAGEVERANALYRRFVEEFPQHDRSPALMFRLAVNHAAAWELDPAIQLWERLYRLHGSGPDPYPDAALALYLAGFHRALQGDHVGAAQNFETYHRRFPELADAEHVYWMAGLQWRQVSDADALAFYQQRYLPRYAAVGPADHVLDALYFIAVTVDTDEAWAAVWRDYEARTEPVGPVGRNRAAAALWHRVQNETDPARVVADCERLLQVGDVEYATAAMWRVANLEPAALAAVDPDMSLMLMVLSTHPFVVIEDKGRAVHERNVAFCEENNRWTEWCEASEQAVRELDAQAPAKPETRGAPEVLVVPRAGPVLAD